MMFQGLIVHILPWVASVTDLWLTDMALEKKHWWLGFVTMFPFYMVANLVGSLTMGSLVDGSMGTLYTFEDWYDKPITTIGLFIFCGFIQGGLIYCTAACMDRIWPKRAAEHFDLPEAADKVVGSLNAEADKAVGSLIN